MDREFRNEKGMALSVVLFALVVVGVMVGGALFVSTQEQRMGENSRRLEQSFGVAEYGLADRIRTWRTDSINGRGVYPADSLQIGLTTAANRSGSFGGWIYKLNDNLFMLDVVGGDTMSRAGRVTGGGARQRLALITRLRPLQVNLNASLTTRGNVRLQGNAAVDGTDAVPTTWTDCAPPGAPVAGVLTDGGNVTTGGGATVVGVPPVNNDPSINDSTFTQFGELSYNDIAAMASVTLPGGNYRTEPVLSGVDCNRAVLTNWGDGLNPLAPCGSYMPIIHITGNATLNGVQGQGILLVDGSLSVQGSYEFYGITIIQGDLSTSGGGVSEAHFWGGVMARNADVSTQTLSGKATLNFSSCAIKKALNATALPTVLRSRGWSQLY
jgi:hypothetical protein